ncbi:MAG: hypothetical protein KJ737_03450 [Proteobacteria bacterium]|nr:hypothetical protein [Pseudomonadota bacterium]
MTALKVLTDLVIHINQKDGDMNDQVLNLAQRLKFKPAVYNRKIFLDGGIFKSKIIHISNQKEKNYAQ